MFEKDFRAYFPYISYEKEKRRQKKLFHFISLDFQFFLFSNPLTKNNISKSLTWDKVIEKTQNMSIFWIIDSIRSLRSSLINFRVAFTV